ncbi:hypothetical protein DVH24_013003, partial [Malus domestica]
FCYQQSSPSSLSRRYELNHSLGILKVEPRSPVHELRRAPPLSRPFPAKPRLVGRRFPASPTDFEAFSGQTTAS